MKVFVYTFRDGYRCWQSAMSAAERRAEGFSLPSFHSWLPSSGKNGKLPRRTVSKNSALLRVSCLPSWRWKQPSPSGT